ncbi:MAG: excinuclease ABC subunit UvrA [Candidatus Poribacteria bacterium]
MLNEEAIIIRGARVHNLKNINAVIPRNRLVVITGPSGSGKSSLAFDTIYAEGQRRYIESLSVYARQFLEQLNKPDVDFISGLSPTISIEQRTASYNPRSTVGTVTEIYDYLRLLFSRIAKPFCWSCKKQIYSQSPQQMVDLLMTSPDGSKISILAPIVRTKKGEHQRELLQLRQSGFVRAKVNGETLDISDEIILDKNKKHDISVYIDRFIIKHPQILSEMTRLSESVELALKLGGGLIIIEALYGNKLTETLLSEHFACHDCQVSYPPPEPRSFSFNSPMGACPSCNGLGIDIQLPTQNCSLCNGSRLRKENLSFKISNKNIAELCSLTISALGGFFSSLPLNERETMIAKRIVHEIISRCNFLEDVGVGYLSLNRTAESLSGGESQRIRLATQISSTLVGVIYVLDEPSIGLHQKDNKKLITSLKRLRDLGNSVIVVEHDREMIENADWILDLGPGSGNFGGQIMAEGEFKKILLSENSLTGKYMRHELTIDIPMKRRSWKRGHVISIKGATKNNLKKINADIPLGVFNCITGVSGSGKSSLIIDTLYMLLLKSVYKTDIVTVPISSVDGLNHVDKVVIIDQTPIGKTPRSNPATYTGIFSLIRNLFASLPESRLRGYSCGRFSFNVKGGRCESCEGDGVKKIAMHFLPDVFVQCAICKGHRYNRETLDIHYKKKTISDVLELSADEAFSFFEMIPALRTKLKTLCEVGLGYVHLGQSANTLSGGEIQRVKLAKELSKRGTGKTVYILDEPSAGLHFDDIKKLIQILQSLVNQGNTVIVIEHNLDIIKVADHIIDLGPGGGANGGFIIATGTPEQLAKMPKSDTGTRLGPLLQ